MGEGEDGRGEAEGGLSPRRPGRELELERRGSCNPLGAVGSWLVVSHRKQQRQEEEGSGVGKGRAGAQRPASSRPGPKGEQTESALLAQDYSFFLFQSPCQGCPSFCRGITPVVLLPLLHSLLSAPWQGHSPSSHRAVSAPYGRAPPHPSRSGRSPWQCPHLQ